MGTYVTTQSSATDILNAAQDEANALVAQRNMAFAQDHGVSMTDSAGATINVLDYGAVEAALDFARSGYEALNENFQDMLDLIGMSNESTADLTQAAADEIATAYQTAEGVASPISTAHLTTAMIIAGVIAVFMVTRKKKKA